MIFIKVPEVKDKEKILNLLNEEDANISSLENERLTNSMVVWDGDKIIGYSSYFEVVNTDTVIVDILIVKSEYRGQYIGDGLIKALLNLADKKQIKKVYAFETNNNSLFYEKAGFIKSNLDQLGDIIDYIGNELENKEAVGIFEAILPDFFDTACKSSH